MARLAARHLRPAKIRNAVRRRWFEHRLALEPEVAVPMTYLGTDYGGWHVPDGLIDDTWLCYCIGAGADVSYDVRLVQDFGARVRAFDPLEDYREPALAAAGHDPRFSFHACAITEHDGPLRVWKAQDPSHGALSAANLQRTAQSVEVQGRSLPSLMAEFGEDHVDLMKVDLEGIEYQVVPGFDLRALGVRVFSLELHHTGTVRQARSLIARIEGQGFTFVQRQAPTNFTWLRSDLVPRS